MLPPHFVAVWDCAVWDRFHPNSRADPVWLKLVRGSLPPSGIVIGLGIRAGPSLVLTEIEGNTHQGLLTGKLLRFSRHYQKRSCVSLDCGACRYEPCLALLQWVLQPVAGANSQKGEGRKNHTDGPRTLTATWTSGSIHAWTFPSLCFFQLHEPRNSFYSVGIFMSVKTWKVPIKTFRE